MYDVSEKTSQEIYSRVQADLEPRLWAMIWRIGLSLSIGGVLSMVFCGQFGIGFTEMAHSVHHKAIGVLGPVQCAIFCGVVFAIAPVIVLRLLSSGMLFRQLILRHGLLTGIILLGVGSGMYLAGNYGQELLNVLVWALAAFASFKLTGLIITYLIEPQIEQMSV